MLADDSRPRRADRVAGRKVDGGACLAVDKIETELTKLVHSSIPYANDELIIEDDGVDVAVVHVEDKALRLVELDALAQRKRTVVTLVGSITAGPEPEREVIGGRKTGENAGENEELSEHEH